MRSTPTSEVVVFDVDGTPTLSFTASLLESRVLLNGEFTLPTAQTISGPQGSLRVDEMTRDLTRPGLCGAAWLGQYQDHTLANPFTQAVTTCN